MAYERSEVTALLDKLDNLILNAKSVPLTTQVRIERAEIYQVLDELRATLGISAE